jgi:hypothetical protein
MTARFTSWALAALLVGPAPLLSQNGDGRVEFERPSGYRLTSLGAKVSVSARVVDARRRAVPNRPIAYRIADPSIAIVSQQGVVQSRRVGRTRIWAVSGTDSTSALIMVDQWATKFAFSPSPMVFDAIGSQVALDVQLRDASGNIIPGAARRTAQCRPRENNVVQMDASGKVQAKANGVTWIRCADRGIADSVRVEVRQRAARAEIVDKLQVGSSSKAVPDTFRLRVRALDPRGDTIPAARGTWASLNTNMVTIDPVNGLARAVGPGTARIVAQVADATDTLTVTITGTALATAEAAPSTELVARQPTLEVDIPSLIVGDTAKLTLRAADAAGIAIANPDINTKITSTNDSIVRYVGRQRILPVAAGSAYILARLDINGVAVVESILVRPAVRGASSASASAVERAPREFKRPERDTSGARARNAEQIRSLMKAIVDSGIGKTTSGRTISAQLVTGLAKHATKLSPTVSEARSGILFGGSVVATPLRKLMLSGTFKTGNLTVQQGAGEDMSVTEADGQLSFWPVKWFGLGGGYMVRGESTPLSLARWSAANVTAEGRGTFVGGAVTTTVGLSMFPYSAFSGDSIAPEKTSLAGEAGVDLRIAAFVVGVRYHVENFTFPAKAGTSDKRTDQFSTIRLRLGAKFGR